MANSINTNASAIVALQLLDASSQQVAAVQNRISTGLKVGSAKDNGATWSIAQNMRSHVATLQVVNDSLNRAQSTLDVASSAAASITDMLTQLKGLALSLNDTSLDDASHAAIQNDIVAMVQRLDSTAKNADFNGINLLQPGNDPPIVIPKNTGFQQSIYDATTLDGRPSTVTYKYTIFSTLGNAYQYIDADGSGQTSQAEMRQYYSGFGQSQAAADAQFAKMDIDASGGITSQEKSAYDARPTFSALTSALGAQPSFAALDANADGTVDAAEAAAYFTGQGLNAAQASGIFSQMDADASGDVTSTERDAYYATMHADDAAAYFTGQGLSSAQASDIFNLMDADGSGDVTSAERDAYYSAIPDGQVNTNVDIDYTGDNLNSSTDLQFSGGVIHRQDTVQYGDHEDFNEHLPSDIVFNANLTTMPTSVLPVGAGQYGISLDEIDVQPDVYREQFTSGVDGGKVDIYHRAMTAGALGLGDAASLDPQNLLDAVDSALAVATKYSQGFAREQNVVEASLKQNSQLTDALTAGVGNLVDADMGEESAKLQAAQAKQKLSVQALSIANTSPQFILSLFR